MSIPEEYKGDYFVLFYQHKREYTVVRRDSVQEFLEDKTERKKAGYKLLSAIPNVNGKFFDKALDFAEKIDPEYPPKNITLFDILDSE